MSLQSTLLGEKSAYVTQKNTTFGVVNRIFAFYRYRLKSNGQRESVHREKNQSALTAAGEKNTINYYKHPKATGHMALLLANCPLNWDCIIRGFDQSDFNNQNDLMTR